MLVRYSLIADGIGGGKISKKVLLSIFFAITLLSFNCVYAIGEDQNLAYSNNSTYVNKTFLTNTTQSNNAPQSDNCAAGEPTRQTTYFSVNQIKVAASTVRNSIEKNRNFPNSVLIGQTQVTMPQFLELLTTATIQINNGNTNPIPLRNYSAPTSPLESIVPGNIPKTEYLKIANDIKNYMDTSRKTPDFAYKTSLGTYLRYENLVYMYSMILDYYNTSGNKAAFAAMKPWTVISNKIITYFTVNQIKTAASTVRNSIEKNRNFPNSVLIGQTQVTMPQFLELLTTATIQINNGNTNPIPLRNYSAPTSPLESIVPGNIPKTEYLKIANDIKNYMDTSRKTPDFAYKTSLGTYLRYENLVYMYSMILDYYNTSGNKAAFAAMKPWTVISNKIITYFTVNQIKTAASTVRNSIEKNRNFPNSVLIGQTQVTMPQFLELLTTATIQINNGNTNPIPLRNYSAPTSPLESIVPGNIPKTEYLKIANDIKNYMDTSRKTPDFAYKTSLGTYLRYENLVYMYSMILDYYNTSGNKAAFAAMKPWVAVIYTGTTGLTQYLGPTANCQSNNPTIIAYAKGIIGNTTDPYERAVKIFNWARDCVEYSFYYNTTKGALGVLNDGNGNCCDISHLIVALSRSMGLAARYEHGTCNFASGPYGHVWAQIYVGAWFNADGSNNCNEFGVINNWDTANYIHRGYYASLPF
ncbi:hypothetical protein BK008_10385 [Methanobacterium sp. MZ-A1]|uniref:transglutaminase-like domain-containing protein n=1 Tax=Methanobacterium sp. MZ-A1 TaxID=1911685 RepID=UPI000C2D4A52|nr:transglutaminase family protein [Methanobacterium sp. MZ-A1]AUB58678.1 hypothetical protein BK008_10385 [Methanobacterium sp. MZ-A1]MBW4257370.1 transglutaminase family protein [Methanobacterium sp. YSL]